MDLMQQGRIVLTVNEWHHLLQIQWNSIDAYLVLNLEELRCTLIQVCSHFFNQ